MDADEAEDKDGEEDEDKPAYGGGDDFLAAFQLFWVAGGGGDLEGTKEDKEEGDAASQANGEFDNGGDNALGVCFDAADGSPDAFGPGRAVVVLAAVVDGAGEAEAASPDLFGVGGGDLGTDVASA